MEQSADVVVIGGGIVGTASAYYLSKRGLKTVLVEKAEIAGEQSGRNWGFVRQQGRFPAELPLAMESLRIWPGLEEELGADIEWSQGGNLAVAADPERMALNEEWARMASAQGLDTRVLTPAQISELIPTMRGGWVGGLFTPTDGGADPVKATSAFATAAGRLGAAIEEQCAAEGIEAHDGVVSGVVTERGVIRTSKVVCAGGAWAARLARTVGVDIPQRKVALSVAATEPTAPVTPVTLWGPGGPGVSFRQQRNGSFVIAGGGGALATYDLRLDTLRHVRWFLPAYMRNRGLFRFRIGAPMARDIRTLVPGTEARRHPFRYFRRETPVPDPGRVKASLASFHELMPSLSQLRIERSWAGYIDSTPDAQPIYGEVGPRGFFVATGLSGHGFGMGPIAGRLMSELVVDGHPSLDLHPFRLARFSEGDMAPARVVL